MSSIPKEFPDLPVEMQQEILLHASEKDVYSFVISNREYLFSKHGSRPLLEELPLLARKYYTYVINQEIWRVHKDERLTTMFQEIATPAISKSERELATLLPSSTVGKYLTRLNLSKLSDEEIHEVIAHLPETCEHVTEIDLSKSSITATDLKDILPKSPIL